MYVDNHGYTQYDSNEILALIKKRYKKHGKIVTRDLKHRNGLPSINQVINIFGSFQNCILEAGISIENKKHLFNRECLSDKEMIESYKNFVTEHLKTHIYLPTNDEVDACPYIQNTCVYIRRFGSFENLNQLIGYNQKEFNRDAMERDMLHKYKCACEDIGHVLNSREITALSKSNKEYLYSTEAYITHFGSLHNLQEICKFNKTRPGRNVTEDELIEKLQWLSSELGRVPVQNDLYLYKTMPSVNKYVKVFGSYKNALLKAELSNKRVYKTKNGTLCRSTFELRLAQMLESYNIPYKNEVLYQDIIPGFKKKYRFDFEIFLFNQKLYIELFGIIGNSKYEKRKQEKIQICKTNRIPLIQLFQKDIYSKSNHQIYKKICELANVYLKVIA